MLSRSSIARHSATRSRKSKSLSGPVPSRKIRWFTAILKLDYLTGVLIGCLLIILNFHWTAHFVHNLIRVRKVQAMNLIFYLSKFAFSALVLFGALIYFDFPPLALLIGLSNIVIAVTIYSVITSIRNPA